jgi:hypothetical protein
MRRKLSWILAGVFGVLALAFLVSAFFFAQRADYGWSPEVERPTWTAEHPRVLFDEGHHEASTAGLSGRYWPFARLLRADGYDLVRTRAPLTPGLLSGGRVLVIADAAGALKPQLFGINLPVATGRRRSDPAFTTAEIDAVREWVERGGSLLLIADHAPFGQAVAALAASLGVTLRLGFVEVPGESSDPLVFSDENGRLGEHPILAGGDEAARVRRVMTYTGESLDGPPGAAVLLRLPASAVEAVPAGNDELVERPAGSAQGVAFELGRGRVVVLGEAAMATAQVARRVPYGMNTGDNDNRQFVLNTMAWLTHRL